MDQSLFWTLFLFAVQIAAGVAPLRWPQCAWLAGLIFWVSGAFAVMLLIYWTGTNSEWLVKYFQPNSVVLVGLVIALSGAGWQTWRSHNATQSTTAVGIGAPIEPHERSPQNVETRLRLQFGAANTIPAATDLHNIWRWYTLLNITVVNKPDGSSRELKTRALFLTLDQPIDVKQVLVTRLNGTLPRHEVKDTSAKSVVIAFLDDVVDSTIEIRLLTTPTVPQKSGGVPATIRFAEFRPSRLNGAQWDEAVLGWRFDPSAETHAECEIVLPDWAQEHIQFRVNWSHGSTSTAFGVIFGLRGKLAQQSEFVELAAVSGQNAKAGERDWTEWSTPLELPLALPNDLYLLQLFRAVADTRDTMAIDAVLHAIQLRPASVS